jgi:hypothetical protein
MPKTIFIVSSKIKWVGWVKRSETQHNIRIVGSRSSTFLKKRLYKVSLIKPTKRVFNLQAHQSFYRHDCADFYLDIWYRR